jgi:two-component system cell cycle sensor histidine kinase/response regulator CckA
MNSVNLRHLPDAACQGQIEILIAEDSPTQAAELSYHLSEHGYHVSVTRNGQEALARVRSSRPRIVITDIVMPVMDGYALCRAIKSDPIVRETPVILLTSLSGPQDVLKGLECGADNFIRKPYHGDYLLSRIEYILKNQELRRRGAEQAGVRLFFGGHEYYITAEKQQILDLLISTYESATHINHELATKQLELARERDLLHTLMDNVPDFIYFKDVNGRFTRINRALAALLRLPDVNDAYGRTDGDFFEEPYASEARADEENILNTGDALISKIEHLRRPGAPGIWLSTTKMLVRDVIGSNVGTFGVSRDITLSKIAEEEIRKAKDELETRVAERTEQLASAYRQLERELAERERAQKMERETQARFRFLFENNPLPMWVYDLETLHIFEVNQAAVNHYGYSAGEFKTLRMSDIEAERTANSGEVKHRIRKGTLIDVQIAQHTLDWGGRMSMLVVAQDTTEQKRLQREFIQSQKMEAIGTLAAGVAHDFNNLLTVVNGYCGFVLDRLTPDNPIYEDVKEVNKAGERAATLTRQLLAFSRKQISQPRVLDLNGIVADMDRMLRRLIGEDIELRSVPDPSLLPVKADPGQMEQVIVNLAVNARDAMPRGGKLIIETNNVNIEEAFEAKHPARLKPGPYAMLAVTDTGIGMDAATQARIFEPFFTTKEPGRGTGLGLSTVYGIVEQTGGSILVYSELERGTTFKVYLPAAPAVPLTRTQNSGATALPRGGETVLVVEDEDGVRALECRALATFGYSVLSASNAAHAIETTIQHNGAIDLLVTDVVMPGMSGADLARSLKERWPSLKVLFTSGYTDNAIIHQGVRADKNEFLAKPFGPRALVRKVREVLDSKN